MVMSSITIENLSTIEYSHNFNRISTGGRCFPHKFCLLVDNFFSFGSVATKFADFS